jgi:hypothetical protein
MTDSHTLNSTVCRICGVRTVGIRYIYLKGDCNMTQTTRRFGKDLSLRPHVRKPSSHYDDMNRRQPISLDLCVQRQTVTLNTAKTHQK